MSTTHRTLALLICASGFVATVMADEAILIEQIPGSTNWNDHATWWGFNQSKITRRHHRVFTYVVDNGTNRNTLSYMRIMMKEGDGAWQSGASFPCSRPGNIVVDSTGVVHAFVFEPFNVTVNDSIGSLEHYWFPGAPTGDIVNYQHETIVSNDGSKETVNIRIGASAGENGRLCVGYGLGVGEHLWYAAASGAWSNAAVTNLGYNFYYPYALVTTGGYHLLALQDHYTGPGTNLYQQVQHVTWAGGGVLTNELMVDLMGHPLAPTRQKLVETSDLYQDATGALHAVWKEFTDPANQWNATWKHAVNDGSGWTTNLIEFPGSPSVNWIRLVEADGTFYYLAGSWDRLFKARQGDTNYLVEYDIPGNASGIYVYASAPRAGTDRSESYIDVLLLCGWSGMYPEAPNYYMRIPKTTFLATHSPMALKAGDGTQPDRVVLTWRAVSNAIHYQVWRGTTTNPASAELIACSVTTTNYEDASATPGKIYHYWIKAQGPAGFLAQSEANMGYIASADDDDGDGIPNWQEELAGTDSHNSNSFLRIEWPTDPIRVGGVVVMWSSADHRVYRLERADALSAGFTQNVATGIPAIPTLNVYTDTTAAGRAAAFYRIGLESTTD